MPHLLTEKPSVINQYLAELRDEAVQQDRARFRNNLRRIAKFAGYEISKTLAYEPASITTPLGIANTELSNDRVVIATILRAGLPMYEGLLEVFDQADSAFASAYRKHNKDGSFDINMPYLTCPSLDGSVLILADPMIATGASIHSCLLAMEDHGTPKSIHVVTAIASVEAVAFLKRRHSKLHVWAAAVDEELTAKSYIVPGLGDAGDLAYGPKLQE